MLTEMNTNDAKAYTIDDICQLVAQITKLAKQRDDAYDAIRKIAVTSHSTSEEVRWNAIEDAERLLPDHA